jgi:vitamin B12 transporter
MNFPLDSRRKLHGVRLGVLMLTVSASFANATQPRVDEVVVTATRGPEPADATLASTTVVTRADIERLQAQTLPDLLRSAAGVSVTTNGGIGKATSLFMRGAEADQNLILIDGVRIGSTTLGTASLQDLPLEQIERIEIVRGPRSALYGSEALGGVIQLFTRRADAARSNFMVGGGANATRHAAASFNTPFERGYVRAGANYLASRGTNACEGYGAPLFAGCFTDEPDRDAYRNTSVSLGGGATLGAATEIDALALFSSGRVEYDGSFGNSADFRQLTLGTALRHRLGEHWSMRAQLGRATDDSENFADESAAGRFDTTRESASVLLDGTAAAALWTFGVDAIRDRVASDTDFVEDSRTTVGVFAQARRRTGKADWQVSIRYDDNEQFGARTTGSVAWGLVVNSAWRVTASIGTGFKAPTFNELYFPGFGNPALEPETSVSAEASVRYRSDALRGSVTAFQSRIADLIGFDENFSPVNIDRTRVRGIEAELTTSLAGVNVTTGIDWLDAEDRSDGLLRGNELPRRPRERLRLDLHKALGDVRVGVVGQWVGRRFDNRANTRRLGSYAALDLLADWQATPGLLLQARLANALDRDYATAAFYPQPGRELYVTLRWMPAP